MLDILVEHFEELDFLWEQREGIVFAPRWSLDDLAQLEERAEAHLDGLRIGGAHSVDIARPFLMATEKSAAVAATLTLVAMEIPDLDGEVLGALAGADGEVRDGVRIGLRHSAAERVAERLTQLAAAGEMSVRAAAADVLAFHRFPPPPKLLDLFAAKDPGIRRLAYGAAGRLGGPWSDDMLESALADDDPALRRTALETSARLGVIRLPALCRQAASRTPAPPAEAVIFLGVLGDPADLPLLESLAGRGASLDTAIAALRGLGCMGSIRAVPTLLRAMTDPKLAHAAGAAFVRITGAMGVAADKPLPPPAGLSEDEAELWDDSIPPDPDKAGAWWNREHGRFPAEGRWQGGYDVSKEPLGGVFALLTLESRRDVYLAVRARDPQRTADLELEKRARLQ